MDVFAFHGFLGAPKDFLPLQIPGLKAPYIFNTTIYSLDHWVKDFCKNYVNPHKKTFLIGYSMGARLALYCLVRYPEKFAGGVIICANPGLKTFPEKHARKDLDFLRSLSFLKLPFNEAIMKWNALGVFSKDTPKERKNHDFCARTLSLALRRFSVGRQEYLVPQINKLHKPLLWAYPQDEAHLSKDIKLIHPDSEKMCIKNAGHRLLFSHPELLSFKINEFRNKIESPAYSFGRSS